MKKIIQFLFLVLTIAMVQSCHSSNKDKQEDPNKAPMFRPMHHSKDSANA